jgi:hypothetical protein
MGGPWRARGSGAAAAGVDVQDADGADGAATGGQPLIDPNASGISSHPAESHAPSFVSIL